ncbi:MAG TPA: phosphatidate cytidylyltransferase [Streptosporangiaceae bacterium]
MNLDDAKPERTRRTGRNLPIAIAVGLGLGGLALVTLLTAKVSFLALTGVAVVLALRELSRTMRQREVVISLVPIYLGGTAIWAYAYWLGYRDTVAALAVTVIAVMVWRLPGGADGYLRDIMGSLFAVAYLVLLGVFVALMLSMTDGAHRVLLFLVLTVCSDTGGYFAGILVGKHPLAPVISPKKTWEGLAGSALACLAAGGILLPVLLSGHAWQGLLLGAAVVTAATLGDLVESMIKRDLGIKDMGTLLPGHGGAFDRIDAMLLTAPVTWLLLVAFIPVATGASH